MLILFIQLRIAERQAENTGKHGVIVLALLVLFNLMLGGYKVLLAWGINFLQLSLNWNIYLAMEGLALNCSEIHPDELLEPFHNKVYWICMAIFKSEGEKLLPEYQKACIFKAVVIRSILWNLCFIFIAWKPCWFV